MKGTVTIKLPKYRPSYGGKVRNNYKVTVEADYTVDSNDEYIITAIRCPEGMPETIYDDDFFEAIDSSYAMDLGEAMAIKKGLI